VLRLRPERLFGRWKRVAKETSYLQVGGHSKGKYCGRVVCPIEKTIGDCQLSEEQNKGAGTDLSGREVLFKRGKRICPGTILSRKIVLVTRGKKSRVGTSNDTGLLAWKSGCQS